MDGTRAREGDETGFRGIFRSLTRYRNYRLYYMGHGLSLIGSWMTRLANAWLIYRLTGSAAMVGVVTFLTQAPVLFISPIAGVLLERMNLRRVLIITQGSAALCSLVMSLMLFGDFQPDVIILSLLTVSLCRGLINGFDNPSRQSFLSHIVEDRRDLSNAIALNSSMVHGSRLIGPTVAGVLIAEFSHEGWCYLIDACSYLAMIAGLCAMRLAPRPARRREHHFWQDFVQGIRYVHHNTPMRSIMLLVSCISLTGAYMTLLPSFVRQVLHLDADAQGMLMASAGVGALVGALYLAWRRSIRGLKSVIALASVLFGGSLIWLSFSAQLTGALRHLLPASLDEQSLHLGVSMAILVFTGFGLMVQLAGTNTFLQTIVDEDKRTRVMGLYAMTHLGIAPFGALLAGFAAERLQTPRTLLLCGLCSLTAGVLFALQLPRLRAMLQPIYLARGIIEPEPDTPITAAQTSTGDKVPA